MQVSQYMRGEVATAHPEDGIRRTYFRMRAGGLHHLPVVDGGGQLVGIISDRDLRRPDWVDESPEVAHAYHLDDALQVQDLMTPRLVVVHWDEPLALAVTLLREHRVGALPVLDHHDRLVGMLCALDLLRALGELLESSPEGVQRAVR